MWTLSAGPNVRLAFPFSSGPIPVANVTSFLGGRLKRMPRHAGGVLLQAEFPVTTLRVQAAMMGRGGPHGRFVYTAAAGFTTGPYLVYAIAASARLGFTTRKAIQRGHGILLAAGADVDINLWGSLPVAGISVGWAGF